MQEWLRDSKEVAMPGSDAALVREALQRDARAAAHIVERYSPLVRRCLRGSFASADVDDQIQEVFLRFFRHLSRLRKPHSLRSYLVGITLRCAAMARRRLRLRDRERLTRSGVLPERGDSQPSIEDRQVASRTRALLGRLRPESFRVLELRFLEDREIADVAHGMGVSRATAKRHVRHACARLRALAQTEPVIAEYVGLGRRGAAGRLARGAST
jgi:RNA polymerase sigma-70 factor (ECF subfamily)